jgi:hypothetical protein
MTEETRPLAVADTVLPSAPTIAAALRRQLNDAVMAERNRRGEVTTPEDTYPMHRALARVIEMCGEYSRAFGAAAKEAKAVAEEELVDAVGEQAGIPNQGLTVPDREGDIRIGPDTVNEYVFDPDALRNAVAFEIMESLEVHQSLITTLGDTFDTGMLEGDEVNKLHQELDDFLAELLTMAMGRMMELGRFEPQISKVRKFTADVARMPGADGVASTVTSTIRKHTIYKGVRVERGKAK